MANNRINDSITQAYVDKYMECGRKVSYTELTDMDGVRTYFYDELPQTEAEGYPVASEFWLDGKSYDMQAFGALSEEDKRRCRLRYYYMPFYHEIYIGTTGSGKTTGCVEPQLRAVSTQRNKPNLFLTDPKGELFDRNAVHLKEQGYRLYILNFKELGRSDRWNPLWEIYDLNREANECMGNVKECATASLPAACRLACPKEGYGATCFVYKDKAYPTREEADAVANFDKEILTVDIDSRINQLVNMFITVQTVKDPTWEYGAQEALKGILCAMLEDSVGDPAFTREMMSIKTIQDYYLSLHDVIVSSDGENKLKNHPLMRGKSPRVLSNLHSMFDNAPRTMRSYCGVFDNCMREWFSGHILALTTGNTVELLSEDDSPFAIFVVTRDYEKSDFQVAGLFIDWVYRKMLEAYEAGRTKRSLHFMLDEFGNIPPIRNFENKIATARSRNIWFHLAVQSYKQMDAVYGKDQSCIIRDNCNSQVFLGSQNYETKEIFSKECGMHCIPDLVGMFNNTHSIKCVPLVPMTDLESLSAGDTIIKRLKSPVIFGKYIRSYVAGEQGAYAHFTDAVGLETLTPSHYSSFLGPQYTYPRTKPNAQLQPTISRTFRF
ncbi:MAG: type IV secretory system conjugative DNA transfer family protein [Clostridia bacterium]|nr:type IV secretory system conjugative DNA transfer family protein [Clostridia bacterium]